jgi:hypothetical protein
MGSIPINSDTTGAATLKSEREATVTPKMGMFLRSVA